jgi:xanthine dioxygenase
MTGEHPFFVRCLHDLAAFVRREKDLVLFHNRGVLHTVVGAFKEDQVRAFHQCNLAASDDPVGPSDEDIKKWA